MGQPKSTQSLTQTEMRLLPVWEKLGLVLEPLYSCTYAFYDFNCIKYFKYRTLHTGEKPYSYLIWLLSGMQIKSHATQILLQILYLYQITFVFMYDFSTYRGEAFSYANRNMASLRYGENLNCILLYSCIYAKSDIIVQILMPPHRFRQFKMPSSGLDRLVHSLKTIH